jgi:hypothetical protein
MRNEEFIKCYLIEAIGIIEAIELIEAIGRTIEAIELIGAIRTIETIYIFIRRLIVHYALCIVQR